jgi:hypothetical protein
VQKRRCSGSPLRSGSFRQECYDARRVVTAKVQCKEWRGAKMLPRTNTATGKASLWSAARTCLCRRAARLSCVR